MLESAVEQYLKTEVENLGGIALKFTSPGRRHVNDRLCVLPGGQVWFVETKRPRKKLRPGQARFAQVLIKLGANVVTLNTKAAVAAWINERRGYGFTTT